MNLSLPNQIISIIMEEASRQNRSVEEYISALVEEDMLRKSSSLEQYLVAATKEAKAGNISEKSMGELIEELMQRPLKQN